MEEYEYRGYTISQTRDGYFEITVGNTTYEFPSYDEAADWVDQEIADPTPKYSAKLHTYHIFYVTDSYYQGYDAYVQAYNIGDAIGRLEQANPDLAYITDWFDVDV